MVNINRLNSLISEDEKKISNLFSQIGKVCYERFNESTDEHISDYVSQINSLKEKINENTEQIKQLKGMVKCPKCGVEVPYDKPFCSNCGAVINANPVEEVSKENENICKNCGNPLTAGVAFCTSCGQKV